MTGQTESNRLAYALLGMVVVVFAGSSVVGKFVVRDVPPFTIGFIRVSISSAVLLLLLIRKEGWRLPPRRDWPMFLVLGFLGMFGCNALFHLSTNYTSATNVSLITAGSPIMIAVFSRFILGERIAQWQVTGIMLALLGVVVVITKGSWDVLVNLDFNIGDIIMLGNPIFWALYTVLTKKFVGRYSSLMLVTYSSIVGGMLFLPFMLYELSFAQSPIQASTSDVAALIYLGLLGSTLGPLLWNKGIAKVGANRTGIFMNGVPIFAMLLSALFLGEKITWFGVLGAVMVITGVYLNSQFRQANVPT